MTTWVAAGGSQGDFAAGAGGLPIGSAGENFVDKGWRVVKATAEIQGIFNFTSFETSVKNNSSPKVAWGLA